MSKSTTGLRRAGLATLAVSLTMGGALVAATPAQADWADGGASIGVVDTSSEEDNNQGATLLYPGVNGQSLGDVRLVLPNSFQNGDTIDLAIFDRTATETDPGDINADTAHKLGFTGAPTVNVNSTPYVTATEVAEETEDNTDNTEVPTSLDPWSASDGVTPTTAPVFTASVVQSSRANGLANDLIRLRVSGVQANGDEDARWIVTLSDLMADLGSAVSPGELRVVPFAYNGVPSTTNANVSTMFANNVGDDPQTNAFDPTIETYTVPAFVSPVTFNVGAPNNILADGTAQTIGAVTIAETNNYSLGEGTYSLTVGGGANVAVDHDDLTIATSGGSDEQVDITSTTGNTITFTVAEETDDDSIDNSKVTIRIDGLMLRSYTPGAISYQLSGGTIDDFLPQYAGQGDAVGAAVPAASLFTTVNQLDIESPDLTISSVSTDVERRIGGGDRYETAAKVAIANGENDFVVLASGENFPDALSSNYLSQQIGGGSILLTKQNAVPAVTLDAMRLLGTRTVFVVGGPSAVSNAVVEQLRNTPQYYPGTRETIGQGKLQVIRLAGDDRYETNRRINQYAALNFDWSVPSGAVGRTHLEYGQSSKLTALVATGENYADALAAGPATTGVQGWGNLPLILTRTGSLDANAKVQLTNLGIEQVVLVGGESAVTASVESAMEGMGIAVHRIEGLNRYDTAANLADFMIADVDPTATTTGGLGFDGFDDNDGGEYAFLATGEKFADALAGAPLAGGRTSPILLTRSATLSPETDAWLAAQAATYDRVIAFGLGSAVSPAVLDAANAAIAGN